MINSLRLAIERFHFDRRVFFAIYLVVGLPYLVLTGPFRAPDERNHFLRSYEISEFRFRPYRAAAGVVGDDLPASLSRLSEALGTHSEHRITLSQIEAARRLALLPEQREFVEFSTAVYSPVAYVPSAISIAAGRMFGAGPLALLYFARCGNLIIGSWLMACALSHAGYARLAAIVISLFPTTVSQVATMTADAMSFALAFLWIALVMECAVWKVGELGWKRKVGLLLVALALSQLRPPYPLLGLLIFLVPPRKIGTTGKTLLLWGGLIGLSLLPAVAWNSAAKHLFEKPQVEQRIEPAAQLRWVAGHGGMFWHRAKVDLISHGVGYWQQVVGRLGWLNIRLPAWLYTGFAAVLLVLGFMGSKDPPGPARWQRIVLGALVPAGMVAIELMLYLTFNAIGSPFIQGVQGRYFVALAFVAAFAYSNSLLSGRWWTVPAAAASWLFVGASHIAAWWALARAAGKI